MGIFCDHSGTCSAFPIFVAPAVKNVCFQAFLFIASRRVFAFGGRQWGWENQLAKAGLRLKSSGRGRDLLARASQFQKIQMNLELIWPI